MAHDTDTDPTNHRHDTDTTPRPDGSLAIGGRLRARGFQAAGVEASRQLKDLSDKAPRASDDAEVRAVRPRHLTARLYRA